MSIQACANLVAKADPHRFKAVMAAPVSVRPTLLAIYAANVEISRAPWVTKEHLIAEMRLQWWRDVLQELSVGQGRKHEVVDALVAVFPATTVDHMQAAIDARQWDIYGDPHKTTADLLHYVCATTAGPMVTAYLALGGADDLIPTVRAISGAVGLVRFVNSNQSLKAHGLRDILASDAAPAFRELFLQQQQVLAQSLRNLPPKSTANAAFIEISGCKTLFQKLGQQSDLLNADPVDAPFLTALDRFRFARRVVA